MLQFIKTQHCNHDTMKKKYSSESANSKVVQTLSLSIWHQGPFCSALTLVQSLIALMVQTHSDLGSGGNIEFYINQYCVPNTLLLLAPRGRL